MLEEHNTDKAIRMADAENEQLKNELAALKMENEQLKKTAAESVSLTDLFALLQQARSNGQSEDEEDSHAVLSDWISYDRKVIVFKDLLEKKMGAKIKRTNYYTCIHDSWGPEWIEDEEEWEEEEEEDDRCGCEGTSSWHRCCGEEPWYNLRD